jgi:hypothetical protein
MLGIYIEKTECNATCRMFLCINIKKKYQIWLISRDRITISVECIFEGKSTLVPAALIIINKIIL